MEQKKYCVSCDRLINTALSEEVKKLDITTRMNWCDKCESSKQLMIHFFNGSSDFLKFKHILITDPGVNPNVLTSSGDNFLHFCCTGNLPFRSVLIEPLLAHPKIDVNALNSRGFTPLALACQTENHLIVELLLSDERVDASITNNMSASPLWLACQSRSLKNVKLLTRSGKDLGDLYSKVGKGMHADRYHNVFEIAEFQEETEIMLLLAQYEKVAHFYEKGSTGSEVFGVSCEYRSVQN